ncbi:MAG: hypothetical protein KDD61_08050 [Bdellovibrionales bacterium]|nr:hypothetical protein [Bdellovibrionales bacterium]
MSTVMTGLDVSLLFAGPLLTSGAASLLFYLIPSLVSCASFYRILQFLSLVMVPISLLGISYSQYSVDHLLELHSLQFEHFLDFNSLNRTELIQIHGLLYLSVSLPFLFYGAYITLAFRKVSSREIGKIYALELSGLLVGLILSCYWIDHFSLKGLFILLTIISGLSVLIANPNWERSLSIIFVAIGVHQFFYFELYEPDRDLNWVARDFQRTKEVTELKKSWTTYAKVQTISVFDPASKYKRKIIAIGDGAGHAGLHTRQESGVDVPTTVPSVVARSLDYKDLLVIFSGAGSDMISIDYGNSSTGHITGVEMNPKVIEHALKDSESLLPETLKKSHINMVRSEGRLFLERTPKTFDSILFSWSGATYANFSGARIHTTQYVFTKESLYKAYSKLKDQGYLIFFGASKVNLILTYMELSKEHGLIPIRDSAVVYEPKGGDESVWLKGWDPMTLIIKKGHWTNQEISRLTLGLENQSYSLLYNPLSQVVAGRESEKLFRNLVLQNRVSTALKYLRSLSTEAFGVPTDDLPFAVSAATMDLSERGKNIFNIWKSRPPFAMYRIVFSEGVIAFLILLVLLFFFKSRFRRNHWKECVQIPVQLIFGFSASAFILVYTYKALLFVGNPTSAIAYAQGGALVASVFAAAKFESLINFKKGFEEIVLYFFILGVVFYDFLVIERTRELFFIPQWGLGLHIIFIFSISFSISYFYLKSLKRIKETRDLNLPFYISINLVAGALAAAVVPLLIEGFGIRWVSTGVAFLTVMGIVILYFSGESSIRSSYGTRPFS